MASDGAMGAQSGLVGRDRECAVIDDLLVRAVGGEGGALVVRGEPGIGKSALLEYAVRRAGAMAALVATGVEGESDLPFGGLYGLVRPIVDRLGELPGVQTAALAGALGLGPATKVDRLLVSAAVLGLLAAAAEAQPVLCVVDDAQWLDRPSADALVFAARRLRGERLAMLFGAREGESRLFEAAGLRELRVPALEVESARVLVSQRTADAVPAVRERLLAEAAGNPLALLELPSVLSGQQLSGGEPLPEAIPLTPRLQGIFQQRIERLPDPTRTSLRIVAAEDTGDAGTVVRAMAQVKLQAVALDAAERADLIRISGGRVSFRHPLVRSALWDRATLSERRTAHTALADALTGEENADRRVWHQAMATLNPDEEVAAALEASARRARARAAPASAATALLRAAELSIDENRRLRRLASAARAAWDAGQPDRAREAIAGALPAADGELHANLLQLSGIIEARCGSLPRAVTRLLQAADVSTDGSVMLELLVDVSDAAIFCGQLATVAELGERARVIDAQTPLDRVRKAVVLGFSREFSGDHAAAEPLLREVIREADAIDDPHALTYAAHAATMSGRGGDGLPYINRAVDTARRKGLLSDLATALRVQAYELLADSKFELALVSAQEAYQLTVEVGHGQGWPLAHMAMVEAIVGREGDARRHSETAVAFGRASESSFLVGAGEWARGFLDLANGRPEEATTRLLAVTDLGSSDVNPFVAFQAMPDLVEAASRCARADALGHRLAAFEGWTASGPSDGRLALLARCQALLGVVSPGEAFSDAIARGDGLAPFERARTELLFGEWLRRERRRQEARTHLRAALEVFHSLGAVPFADRAETELRATGETARKRDPSTLDDLTPQELQIARLVAEGLTNKEIAAQLFLSPRTIDYHLRKVFPKLGIASRTELVRSGLPTRDAP